GAKISNTEATVGLRVEEASSRWGRLDHLRLTSGIYPVLSDASLKGTFTLELDGLKSESTRIGSVRIAADTRWSADMKRLLTNHVSLAVSNVQTRWARASGVDATLVSFQPKPAAEIATEVAFRGTAFKTAGTELADASLRADFQHALPFPTPAQLLSQILSSV